MPSLLCNRSAAHANLGEYIEATADAEKAIQVKPTFVKAYARKGLALFQLGRTEEARVAYYDGLQQDSTSEALRDGIRQCDDLLKTRLVSGEAGTSGIVPGTGAIKATVQRYGRLLVNPLQIKRWRDWFLYCGIMMSIIFVVIFKIQGFSFSNPRKLPKSSGDELDDLDL